MEAVITGVPGIAFSLASQDKPANIPTDYSHAAQAARAGGEESDRGRFIRRRCVEREYPLFEF